KLTDRSCVERELRFRDPSAAHAAHVAHDDRPVAGGVESELDVIFSGAIRHEAYAAAWCEDRERIALRPQDVRDLTKNRNRDPVEKLAVLPGRVIRPRATLGRRAFRAIDRLLHA